VLHAAWQPGDQALQPIAAALNTYRRCHPLIRFACCSRWVFGGGCMGRVVQDPHGCPTSIHRGPGTCDANEGGSLSGCTQGMSGTTM